MHPPPQPYVRIQAARAFTTADLRDLWSYRDVLFMLAVRGIKLRYKQTALGVAWVVLQTVVGAQLAQVNCGNRPMGLPP